MWLVGEQIVSPLEAILLKYAAMEDTVHCSLHHGNLRTIPSFACMAHVAVPDDHEFILCFHTEINPKNWSLQSGNKPFANYAYATHLFVNWLEFPWKTVLIAIFLHFPGPLPMQPWGGWQKFVFPSSTSSYAVLRSCVLRTQYVQKLTTNSQDTPGNRAREASSFVLRVESPRITP